MKRIWTTGIGKNPVMGATIAIALAVAGAHSVALSQGRGGGQLSGMVDRVWEDGFDLQTENRRVRVDSWDICGDNTPRHISTGDRVTVTGEFEGGEFDAFVIADGEGKEVCVAEMRTRD
ncbi:hypothetical protein [Lyngbya sp. CCY1209]|jgi:hypothetical protein|uniref:hypothetical protein n=1 Tax=Lyngbya sp. CCY1209 TaxID=2886103 RepID=UPI002D20323B|nr:hypothetical protein [Lyngbya sp. CCY1209]MEB3885732.1 hypothetical protein [Lyngbya sp. CCY1209]